MNDVTNIKTARLLANSMFILKFYLLTNPSFSLKDNISCSCLLVQSTEEGARYYWKRLLSFRSTSY